MLPAQPMQPVQRGIYSIGEDRDEGRCRRIDSLAKRLGAPLPKMDEWHTMLCAVLEKVPLAILVVDMKVPGLPMSYVNPAMVALTGYAKEQLEGHNCRMLQGPKSEAAAVDEIVGAIRTRRKKTLRVTNYRADGSEFVNVLSIHPVRDSAREYRYCIGVLGDEQVEGRERRWRDLLLPALPAAFNEALQSGRSKPRDGEVSMAAQAEQSEAWRPLLAKFARLLWSMDWKGSLRLLIASRDGVQLFARWLAQSPSRELNEDAITLEFVQLVEEMQCHPDRHYGPQAIRLCHRLLGVEYKTGDAALQARAHHRCSPGLTAVALRPSLGHLDS